MPEPINFLVGVLLAVFFYSGTIYWIQSFGLRLHPWVQWVVGVAAVVVLLMIAGPIYT